MKHAWLTLALLLLAPLARSEPYAVGSMLEPLELADQHGELRRVDGKQRVLLFTRDMDAGDVLKQALATDGPALLDGAGAAYVADVSQMPALVLRLFALPFADNTGSVRVLEKAGYVREAILRSSSVKYGQPRDQLLYARVNEGWRGVSP